MILAKRYCYDGYGYYDNCNSSWYNWGRWVLFGAIVLGAFALFFIFACISARQRRRRGLTPYRGTGWIGGGGAAPQYGPGQEQPYYQNQAPPPQYGQQGGYGNNPGQGYWGGQGQASELQQPQNAYRGGDGVYAPPQGPPPEKRGDGIVR